MGEAEKLGQTGTSTPQHRIDVQLHDLLMKSPKSPPVPSGMGDHSPKSDAAGGLTLPEPVYPQNPLPEGVDYTEKQYHKINTMRAFKCWALPFVKSRFHSLRTAADHCLPLSPSSSATSIATTAGLTTTT